ncbi:MAG: PP2C family protein-serine/threonine phosphatase [Rhabdochlamydiaceae bacterium]
MSLDSVNSIKKLNFTTIFPSELLQQKTAHNFTPSTLHSIEPHIQISSSLSKCFKNGWQAICKFFKSILNYFRPVSPTDRENRLTKHKDAIHRSLNEQMQRCAEQMAKEPAKRFQYGNAPPAWDSHETTHEECVGNLQVGIAHAQGRRPAMEDEHLATSFDLVIGGKHYPVQLFGIFDGHGGPMAARFVRDHLQRKLRETLIEFNPSGLSEGGIWRALKMTCVRLNNDFKNQQGSVARDQGTTATIAMILDNHLWTANVGDARTILDNDGTPIQLSHDAKPDDVHYRKGIEHRGGAVIDINGTPRVNGSLAVGRAIGDHHLNGAITARPKITVKPLAEIQHGSHLILCCDGIFDVSTTASVANAAHANKTASPKTLARNIIYSAYQAGSTDNLSALVVKIK